MQTALIIIIGVSKMTNILLAGEIGRLATAGTVASDTDYLAIYQSGILNKVTPDTILSDVGAITSTSTITAPRFIDSTAISTASTSTTMSATGASLVGKTSAATFPLAAPGTPGCFKYIRCTNATTSRKIKISVAAASATINNSKTVITLSNIGDSVTLFGETSTRWGICGSFVAGTTRIATS